MLPKIVLALSLLCLSVGTAAAQAGAGAGAPVTAAPDAVAPRNPNLGDRVVKPRRAPPRSVAAQDKQPPGIQNGNEPDRASAGGGGR